MSDKKLIILHGWGSSREGWREVKDLVEKEGIEVLAPDLPGFKKENRLKEAWDTDRYLRWVEEYVRDIDSPFYLLGQSFGGGLAVKYAAKHADDLSGLILVSAAVVRLKNKKKIRLAAVANLLSCFSFLPGYELLRKFFYYYVLKRSDYIAAKGHLRETFKNVTKEDLAYLLPRIDTETLLLWGEEDSITSLKDAELINQRIKDSCLKVFEGVGHAPHLETPAELSDEIVNFIKKG